MDDRRWESGAKLICRGISVEGVGDTVERGGWVGRRAERESVGDDNPPGSGTHLRQRLVVGGAGRESHDTWKTGRGAAGRGREVVSGDEIEEVGAREGWHD